MPHQPVEVVGRGGAGVDLQVAHFGHGGQEGRHLAGRALGAGQRRALGHVDHYLEFVLVVERQGLEDDHPERHHGQRGGQQAGRDVQELPAVGRGVDQFLHQGAVGAVEQTLPVMRAMLYRPLFHYLGVEPRRKGESHAEREHHGHGGAYRYGPHVRPHHAADESHGQDGGYHGPGGEYRRVADLVHGVEDVAVQGVVPVEHAVAVDVLHHHYGVVYEDADGEDEREQRDAVEGVAVEIIHQHGQRQRDRDGHQHHGRLAQAQGQGDEQGDRQGGQQHVVDQLVGFGLGRLAVVAGDGDVYAVGDLAAFHGVHLGQDLAGDFGGVGAAALGHGQGDGRGGRGGLHRRGGALQHGDGTFLFVGAVGDLGYF